jgi:predicted ATPase with chaperone activity
MNQQRNQTITPPRSETALFIPEPQSVEETGLDFGLMLDLCLKTVYYAGRPSARLLAERMGLSFKVTDELLVFLRKQEYVEIVGTSGIGEAEYQYALTTKGVAKTQEVLEGNQYVGAAPVPFDQYVDVVKRQTVRGMTITRDVFEDAVGHLVLSDATRDQLGTAVASGASLFVYGEPGNGKSTIAEAIGNMLQDPILVPYAIEVHGQIVRVHDPRVHLPPDGAREQEDAVPEGILGPSQTPASARDRRWAVSRRPLITVGGELTLAELELRYSPDAKFYVAPIQVRANGGVLVVDDFGRQMMRPEELLNRWMIPMERQVDHLTFHTGETVEIPFDMLLVFATNLPPSKLGDEAFYRRIRHKVRVPDPTQDEFMEILRRAANNSGVPLRAETCAYLIDTYYRDGSRPMRGVHPRDLIALITDIARYREQAPEFTPEWIDAACGSYFVVD